MNRAEEYYVSGTPEDCIDKLQQYVDVGIGHFMIRFGDLPDLEAVRLFSKKVIPKINP